MRIERVSAFLPDVTQHIHSLRAKGVTSCHTASARGVFKSSCRKSAGRLCTTPLATACVMPPLYQIKQKAARKPGGFSGGLVIG